MPAISPRHAVIIGVMGGADVPAEDQEEAYQLGRLIAENGWILLNGGRNRGIMEASARGAHEHGGLTVGILPSRDETLISRYIHIPIITGMGSARNSINVLSSRVVVACKGGLGTLSEVALALKHGKPVILMQQPSVAPLLENFCQKEALIFARTPEEVIAHIKILLSKHLKAL